MAKYEHGHIIYLNHSNQLGVFIIILVWYLRNFLEKMQLLKNIPEISNIIWAVSVKVGWTDMRKDTSKHLTRTPSQRIHPNHVWLLVQTPTDTHTVFNNVCTMLTQFRLCHLFEAPHLHMFFFRLHLLCTFEDSQRWTSCWTCRRVSFWTAEFYPLPWKI